LSDRFNDVESDFTLTNLADLIAAFQADIARWNDENSDACFAVAWDTGKAPQSARISFAMPELLWKVLTAKRWAILKCCVGQGRDRFGRWRGGSMTSGRSKTIGM
jgi:hypothetical protein